MNRRNLLALGAAVLASAGCGSEGVERPLAPRMGKNCTVQFRRGDALGSGAALPVAPTTGSINGAAVSVSGKLQAADGQWVTIRTEKTDYCIPQSSILLIEFGN